MIYIFEEQTNLENFANNKRRIPVLSFHIMSFALEIQDRRYRKDWINHQIIQ